MAAAPARAALLAALFAAALAPAPPSPPASAEPLAPATTLQRSRRLAIEAVDAVGGADGAEGAVVEATLSYSEADAEAEAAGVPAWRELWQASLDALRREPTINNTEEEVPVQLGAVAFLHCPVRNLGERGVSWVRRRDWHIISSGVFMYTNDERFQVLHSSGSDDWVLQIKYVQKRDNGTYECQVSTAGGVLSRLVHLRLLVPEAFILGADEYHVDAGSTINLVCIIEKSPVPPQYVFWYHNARMINYDAARGVSVATAPGARTQSALTVRAATPAHSGNYSCRAPNTEPAHILVYVSEGSDKMAATLSRNTGVVSRATVAATVALLLLVAVCRA
ncbi:zwei Ig domain protein zig-8-like [Aricia agestis]|uniref:zwei Ig domain protein zig-8-like n=1 Tax=Aricia agestis TaxID=91739 RepID=UPI001C20A49E|nr:zwei Ig domain protein zig-8-like [Aricia agestis]